MRRYTIPVAAMFVLAAGAGAQGPGGGAPAEVALTTGNLPFDTVKLVPPDLGRPAPLMRAFKERRSVREYDARPLTLRQLSELLWAANGVNRDDGKRTSPAAVNQQLVDIYVVLPVGAFLYDAPGARLLPVAGGDLRKLAGRQEFVASAPVNLIYVADPARFKPRPGPAPAIPAEEKLNWSRIAVGAQAQNVGLYCAAEKLGNVVRAMVDREKLGPALKLGPGQAIVLAQTVGCLKPYARRSGPSSGRGRKPAPGFEADADQQEHDPDSRAGQTRLLLRGQACPRRYQMTLTPYSRKTGSAETSDRRSASACAASSRSKGSRWRNGSFSTAAAWGQPIDNMLNPSASFSVTYSSTEAGSTSRPRLAFIAISQTLAALK